MARFLRIVLITGILLAAAFCGLLCLRKDWVEPVPGVRLEPLRPAVSEADLEPGCAFDLLCRAADFSGLPESVRDEDWNGLDDMNAWDEAAYPRAAVLLEGCRNNLDLARLAVEAGDARVPTYTSPKDTFPYLNGVMKTAKLLRLSALRKAAEGDLDGAFSDLETGLSFGDILSRGGPLIHRMMDIWCTQLCCDTMIRLIGDHDIPDALAYRTMAFLKEFEGRLEPWAEAFRYEYIFTSAYLDIFFDPERVGTLFEGESNDGKVSLFTRILGCGREDTERNMAGAFSHLIFCAENPLDMEARETYAGIISRLLDSKGIAALKYRDPLGLLLAGMMLPSLEKATDWHLERLARLRAARTALALDRYKGRNGRFPSALDELAPEFIETIPLDPFVDGPFEYELDPKGDWILSSRGRGGQTLRWPEQP